MSMPELDVVQAIVVGSAGVMTALILWGQRMLSAARWLVSRIAPALGIPNLRTLESGFKDTQKMIESLTEKLDELAGARRETDDSLGASIDGLRGDIRSVENRLASVEYQVAPNHGGSLRDHVHRLEGEVRILRGR